MWDNVWDEGNSDDDAHEDYWWEVRGCVAIPFRRLSQTATSTCTEERFLRPNLQNPCDWLVHQGCSYVFRVHSATDQPDGTRRVDDLAVASLSGGWVARVLRNGDAEIYDALS